MTKLLGTEVVGVGEERKRWRTSEAEEVAEVMSALAETLPKLVRNTIAILISEEAGRRLGKAVGSFYKELVESGINPSEALKMAKEYMEGLMRLEGTLPRLLEVPGKPKGEIKEAEEAGEAREGEAER